jgi:hypothetical protein
MQLRGSWIAPVLGCALAIGCSSSDSSNTGLKVTADVGPAGGNVSLPSGPSISFPTNALATTTSISVEKSALQPPQGSYSPLYIFGPIGTSLAVKATITIPVASDVTAATIFLTKQGQAGVYDVLPTAVMNGVATAQLTTLEAAYVGGPCLENAACAPTNGCHIGTSSCGTGKLVCTDTGVNAADNIQCGNGQVCKAGTCGTSAPIINSFAATPTTVAPGSSSTLTWNVSAATTLAIDQGVGAVTGATGSKTVAPTNATTYTLTATNGNGSSTKTATVTVSGGGGGGGGAINVSNVYLHDLTTTRGTTQAIQADLTPSSASRTDVYWYTSNASATQPPSSTGGDSTNGTIDATGNYTAPSTIGTYKVWARSKDSACVSTGSAQCFDYCNVVVQ